jgi:hypothetical protein
MKYIFVLGRNVKLSEAEVLAYLERTGNPVKIFCLEETGYCRVKELEKNAVDFSEE